MTHKVKIFENVFLHSTTGHRGTFRGQICLQSAVAKLPKGHVVYQTKKNSHSTGLDQPHLAENRPIAPKILRTLSSLDMSTYT